MRLHQQVAVVTGSTKGLGREMALRFAAEGARVVVHGTDPARAEEVRQACGPDAAVFLGDIAEPAIASALMDFAVEHFGRLDVVVNNAGIVRMEPFLDFQADTWRRMIDIHLSGTFFCAQAAASRMALTGGGRILNMSSIAGSFGQFGFAAYSSVKAGIEALTRVMAIELAGHHISVNCIAPGPVWNDMMEQLYGPERLAERWRTIPLQRMAEPSEVAELALYLLSPAGGYMTGQVLHLDGGASAAGCFTMEVYKRATS